MHQKGWTLHRLTCAKELQKEYKSLEAANVYHALSLLQIEWLKLGSFPIIIIILMPCPVLLQEGWRVLKTLGTAREDRQIPVGLFFIKK